MKCDNCKLLIYVFLMNYFFSGNTCWLQQSNNVGIKFREKTIKNLSGFMQGLKIESYINSRFPYCRL